MSDTHKPRKRGAIRHRVVPGVATALAVLMGLEVALQFIADGHPDAHVRLLAVAGAAGLGAVVAALRRGGAAVVLLACGLAANSAQAADRIRDYDVTISTSACPTGSPGTWTDAKPPGIAISGLRAWNVKLCPKTAGAYFTGTGGWKACVYRSGSWTLLPYFFIDMTDDGYGNPVTTTADNPCLGDWDVQVGVNDGDLLFLYPTTTMGVSSGTQVRVVLRGML